MKADVHVDADWEAQELRRNMIRQNGKGGGHGVQRRSYKALRQLCHGRGFLGNRSRDLRRSDFSDAAYGPLSGPPCNRDPRHAFIVAVSFYPSNNH